MRLRTVERGPSPGAVCVLFNIYDRIADTLGFHLPGPNGYAASGRSLMQRGYLL
jgi:hypothetical protein